MGEGLHSLMVHVNVLQTLLWILEVSVEQMNGIVSRPAYKGVYMLKQARDIVFSVLYLGNYANN